MAAVPIIVVSLNLFQEACHPGHHQGGRRKVKGDPSRESQRQLTRPGEQNPPPVEPRRLPPFPSRREEIQRRNFCRRAGGAAVWRDPAVTSSGFRSPGGKEGLRGGGPFTAFAMAAIEPEKHRLRPIPGAIGATVHGFNLEIADKEFIVLVGPSGCKVHHPADDRRPGDRSQYPGWPSAGPSSGSPRCS